MLFGGFLILAPLTRRANMLYCAGISPSPQRLVTNIHVVFSRYP